MQRDPAAKPGPAIGRETIGLMLGGIGVMIFGGTLPATRIALGTFSPWFITHGRATVAMTCAALILLVLRRRFPRRHAPALLAAGLLLAVGFPGFSSIAMQTVPAAHGGVVLGLMPLTTSIFAAVLAGERPSPLFWICGIVGAALVVTFATRDSGMSLSSGDLWLFAAILSSSLGYVISGQLSRVMPGWEVICWALVMNAPITIAGAIWTWSPGFASAGGAELAAFAYLSLCSMFLGFFAWNVGLAIGGIARVSQVQLLQPFVTIAISAALIGEHISLETLAFAALVVGVVAVGRKARVEGS